MAGSLGRVLGASVRVPWAAGTADGDPSESVKAPYVAEIPAWGPEASAKSCSRPDDLRSWSLGGPNAEAVTGVVEEAPRRRTQQTHCGRPSDSPGAMG